MRPTSPNPVALVTGSGKRRVGWHVADALAQRGFSLAVHYRSSAQEAAESVASFQTRGLKAVALQAGLAMVRQSEGGCIINFGDWAEARPYLNYAAYFPSKGAIPTLTRCLAVELGIRNPKVRVNCILPGPVMLPTDLPEAERKQAIDATLVKREGRPENIAQAALALIDNDFITGVCLPVDGGRTIYGGPGSV